MSMTNVPSTFDVIPVSRLAPRPLDWLWPGRLARGKLALFEGDPELGKSLVTLDLCARLSTGRPFPDGVPGAGPANALVLSAEDDGADTLRPRLEKLGADMDRVFVRDSPGGALDDPLLRLPSETAGLDAMLHRVKPLLVVIDPITAYLDPAVNVTSDPSVRAALLPLGQLAARHQCVVLLVRHLTKDGGRVAVYRGTGSIAFIAVCRSGWLFARDPETPGRQVMAQVKNNLAAPQPSLAYRITGQRPDPPTVDWLGPSPLGAAALVAGPARDPVAAWPRDRARTFLEELLEDGPLTSRDIWARAQEQGLSERTIQRAKQGLEIRSERVDVDGRHLSYWLLPGQKLPPSVSPQADDVDLEPWLAPLREKYPVPTPLDDL